MASVFEQLLKMKQERQKAAPVALTKPGPSTLSPSEKPCALTAVSKDPDQCIGVPCHLFKFDGEPLCTAGAVQKVYAILRDKGQCPHYYWKVSRPEEKSKVQCRVCLGTKWWRSRYRKGSWVCMTCHPPVLEPHKCEYSE